MTAMASARVPLSEEGLTFWTDLTAECHRYTAAVNDAISTRDLAPEQFLQWTHGRELLICKHGCPSTTVQLSMEFLSWGPVIRARVTGEQTRGVEFRPEEWEVTVSKDLDGAVVAIFDEGRSFSPHDLARYVIQAFHRAYPGVSLPYNYRPPGGAGDRV